MGEVENIGPGLSRNLVVDLPKGTYEGACKPGMVGDGIRETLTVTGEAAKKLSDSAGAHGRCRQLRALRRSRSPTR